MGKPSVSRDVFRGLFAFYAAKAQHDYKPQGGHCPPQLFGSEEDIPDPLPLRSPSRCALLSSKTIGRSVDPIVGQLTGGNAEYDHASDFLHTLLRDLGQKVH